VAPAPSHFAHRRPILSATLLAEGAYVGLLTLCCKLLHVAQVPVQQGFAVHGVTHARLRVQARGEDFKHWTVKGLNKWGTYTMKIESSNYPLTTTQNGAQRATNDSDAKGVVEPVQQASAAGAQNSTVNLSSVSALRTSSDSDIDTAKVESIKAALRDGSYTIDSGKIADGMLSNARDLLQTRTR
jgi:negative regulator of flagellin synthesis FlgM